MHRNRIVSALFAALLLITILPAAGSIAPIASADAGCTHYVDQQTGQDQAGRDGSLAQPWYSPIYMLTRMPPGGVGCLEDGATFDLNSGGGQAGASASGTQANPKTLRPATPGARATMQANLGFVFSIASHDIVIKDINFRRVDTQFGGSLMQINGDRIVMDGIDATYPRNICLDIGEDARDQQNVDSTDDVVIRNSRIHDCGYEHLNSNPPATQSGVHGIYVQFTRGILIEDSLIYRNHNRGIQLYPDADGGTYRRNVLHANGANVNIGQDGALNSGNNDFENNIINNSYLSWRQDIPDNKQYPGDTAEILSTLPAGNHGNHVDNNCIRNQQFPANLYEGVGYTHVNNIENQNPLFANAGGHLDRVALPVPDFTLAPNSPCLGKGPVGGPLNIQPAVSGALTLGGPVTDNYKDCFNAPDPNRENRTFFSLGRNVQIGGDTYRPTSADILPFVSANNPNPKFVGGYTLNMTGPTAATLVATPTSTANMGSFFWRVDSPPDAQQTNTRAFGPFFAVTNPLALKSAWIEIELSLMQGPTELGSTVVRYRYEDALYNAAPNNCSGLSLESNGPGGRWWHGDSPSKLNWEASAPAARTLTVSRNGTGNGTVASSPVGLACGAICSAKFINGEPVTLTPTPAGGSTFAGWAGACTGAGACVPVMSVDRSVTATFNTSGGGDTTKPTTTAPTMRIRSSASLNGSQIPVTVLWTGSDTGGSGLKRYDLQRSNDGGATWTNAALATATSTSYSPNVASTGTVMFRVRGVDNANNVGDWSTTTFTPRLAQETATTTTGVWANASNSSHSGGKVKYSNTAGSTASFVVNADWVGFVTNRASNRGWVSIYVDGVVKDTINLYNGSTFYKRLVWSSALTPGAHTIKIVTGWQNTNDRRVDVDAFAYVNWP